MMLHAFPGIIFYLVTFRKKAQNCVHAPLKLDKNHKIPQSLRTRMELLIVWEIGCHYVCLGNENWFPVTSL